MEIFNPKKLKPEEKNDAEIELMKKLLEKMKNKTISDDEYRYLQYYLMKYRYLYQYNPYPLCQIGVTGDKIMFISDTHRGNKSLESKKLIDIAYNEALKQNVNAVVHAGDFIEACSVDYYKKYEVVLKELNTAMSDLPKEIKTGLILGNHDYSAIRTYSKIIPYYFNLAKVEILGMQNVLLNWNNQAIIRINHPIGQLIQSIEENHNEIINLEGHHHYYDLKENSRTIYLPSLSIYTTKMYIKELCSKRLCSLFLIGEKQGDTLLFQNYCINKSLNGPLVAFEQIEVNAKTKQIKRYH